MQRLVPSFEGVAYFDRQQETKTQPQTGWCISAPLKGLFGFFLSLRVWPRSGWGCARARCLHGLLSNGNSSSERRWVVGINCTFGLKYLVTNTDNTRIATCIMLVPFRPGAPICKRINFTPSSILFYCSARILFCFIKVYVKITWFYKLHVCAYNYKMFVIWRRSTPTNIVTSQLDS